MGTCPRVLWDAIYVSRLEEKQPVPGLLVSMAAEGRETKQPGITLKEKKIRQDLLMGNLVTVVARYTQISEMAT